MSASVQPADRMQRGVGRPGPEALDRARAGQTHGHYAARRDDDDGRIDDELD